MLEEQIKKYIVYIKYYENWINIFEVIMEDIEYNVEFNAVMRQLKIQHTQLKKKERKGKFIT